jgi:hypothetical protein
MTSNNSDEKTIPTLVDVIVPGKTEVEGKVQREHELSSPAQTSAKRALDRHRTLSKAALNAKIEALVAEVLIKHMDDARKEIIYRVLSEIDRYVDKAPDKR